MGETPSSEARMMREALSPLFFPVFGIMGKKFPTYLSSSVVKVNKKIPAAAIQTVGEGRWEPNDAQRVARNSPGIFIKGAGWESGVGVSGLGVSEDFEDRSPRA
jgi:hypothetical protein